MKNFLKYSFAGAILIAGMVSCEDDEQNITDLVQETVERGAVLRTIPEDVIGGTADPTELIILGKEGENFFLEVEEQDAENGDLLQEVRVFVRFNDRSILNLNDDDDENDGPDLSTAPGEDILLTTIPASDFTPGPFGLPRYEFDFSSEFLFSVLDQSTFDSDDQIIVRLELVLTDGRTFSADDSSQDVTAGFFNAPFQYVVNLNSGINLNYLNIGLNAVVPQGDDVTAEYFNEVEITDQLDGENIAQVNVYKRFVDNTPENGDNSVEEEQIASFDDDDFDESDDGFPTITLDLEGEELLGDLELEDLSIGDAFFIRYEVITEDGRTVTSDNPESRFFDRINVTDCPVPPITDTELFTGTYNVEQIIPSIFGYDTFDPDGGGVELTLYSEVTDASQVDPGIELEANQRAFDADYLAALGFGNTRTYIIAFDNCKVTLVDPDGVDNGEPGYATGVRCVDRIYIGPFEGGGAYLDDDNTFDLQFTDDVTEDCGTPEMPILRWTKI